MATTVVSSFSEFMKDSVNLDRDETVTARGDRNNLRSRIRSLQTSVSHFPTLYPDADIDFGSFARKTKKRPLDDVDMFFCIAAEGAYYDEDYYSKEITIYTSNTNSNLYQYTNDDNQSLNSIKILNKFKRSVEGIYQYRASELTRNQEAVVLTLNGKDWCFDIVPCFRTAEHLGKTFYIIPNGSGGWKKADPRIDKDRVSSINQKNNGNVLNVFRIVKYWNARRTMHTMGSYLLENIILDYYASKTDCSKWVDMELPNLLNHISNAVYWYVADPKGIQGDLNTLTDEQKASIGARASFDAHRAQEARDYENEGDHERSINRWRDIFGDEFPTYG
ncbi:hypothetical protein ACMSIO_20425 [Pseudomonas benzopyrenica]|uniref:hypothetical protein n=1 Tax=Pseudomonas benzopyrenica TaxID=2993566 RepID=UPI0039C3D362